MSLRTALHLPRRRRPARVGDSLYRALDRANTPALREELLSMQRRF